MSARLLLAAVADDYTGGSDMAGMLASHGVRTLQTFGVPDDETIAAARDAEALVVSLKTRSIAAADAVQQSLHALTRVQELNPRQVQFKYCSTFDSTSDGNIGPVASALMDALHAEFTVAVPALPVNGRTQYLGYLFVNGVLLSESPMRHHPLNPMTEPNLVRHLQAQTTRRVGLIDLHAVRSGRFEAAPGTEIALVDAIDSTDLAAIARFVVDAPLITGGSGISDVLPPVWRERGTWSPQGRHAKSGGSGERRTLILAGSCSAATLAQIREWTGPSQRMRTAELNNGETDRLAEWCVGSWKASSEVLVYSSADAGCRESDASAAAGIERAFGQIARTLAGRYEQLIVAGGETSGAVVEALGVRAVEIGPSIDPGVPALRSVSGPALALALKSGNFGAKDFFAKASRTLQSV